MSNRSSNLAEKLRSKQPGYKPKRKPVEVEAPETLEQYLEQFAPALAQQAQASCAPLHCPGVDEPLHVDLLREPYEAQAHVISAGIKALRRQRSVQIAAEMGTGKTIISQAICQGHSHGRGYRAIVFCPPHLVNKWEREIRMTLTNAHVHHLKSYHDIARVIEDAPPVGRGWWIVSNTRAKMGAKWKPVYLPRRRSNFLRCPRCYGQLRKFDHKLQMDVPLSGDELGNKKLTCQDCESALWQWTHELDRWPIATFIHKQLKHWFDYLIIDESHQTKSAETAVGQAMGSLSAGCTKTICLTGTLFGGYAWHVRPLLFRMAPSTLIEEGIGWDEEMKFNEKYGRLERRVTETEKTGADNRQSKGTTTKTAKYVRPGVMPTLFGRHLIGSTIFLSLDEVAETPPQLHETLIPIPH